MHFLHASPEDVVKRNASELHIVPKGFLSGTHLGKPVLDVPICPIVLERKLFVTRSKCLVQLRYHVRRAPDTANSGGTV